MDATKEECPRVEKKLLRSFFTVIYDSLTFDIHNHLGSCLCSSHGSHFLFTTVFTSSAILSLDPKHHKKVNKLKPNNLPWFRKKDDH